MSAINNALRSCVRPMIYVLCILWLKHQRQQSWRSTIIATSFLNLEAKLVVKCIGSLFFPRFIPQAFGDSVRPLDTTCAQRSISRLIFRPHSLSRTSCSSPASVPRSLTSLPLTQTPVLPLVPFPLPSPPSPCVFHFHQLNSSLNFNFLLIPQPPSLSQSIRRLESRETCLKSSPSLSLPPRALVP